MIEGRIYAVIFARPIQFGNHVDNHLTNDTMIDGRKITIQPREDFLRVNWMTADGKQMTNCIPWHAVDSVVVEAPQHATSKK